MLGRHESAVEDHPIRLTFDGGVARVTLARPPLNILTLEAIGGLDAALEEVGRRPDVKVLLLAAEGRAFCAGVAVEDHLGARARPMLATSTESSGPSTPSTARRWRLSRVQLSAAAPSWRCSAIS